MCKSSAVIDILKLAYLETTVMPCSRSLRWQPFLHSDGWCGHKDLKLLPCICINLCKTFMWLADWIIPWMSMCTGVPKCSASGYSYNLPFLIMVKLKKGSYTVGISGFLVIKDKKTTPNHQTIHYSTHTLNGLKITCSLLPNDCDVINKKVLGKSMRVWRRH